MHMKPIFILTVFIAVIITVSMILLAPAGSPRIPVTALSFVPPLSALPEEAVPLAERLNSTSLLLREPVGGFHGSLIWLVGPGNLTLDYIFYSRDYGPGNVTLSVIEVSSPLNITPLTPSAGISARMVRDRFTVLPKTETESQLIVNVSPEGYSHDPVTRTWFVHADVEGDKNAIADDWIRVQMADRPTTWLDFQTTGDISERDISIHLGGQWDGNITVRLGGRGTGLVHVWFRNLDCGTMESSSLDTPHPLPEGWPEISVDPARFIGRSFGTYELQTIVSAVREVQSGTYCYDITIDAPDEQTSFSSIVHVLP